MKQSFTAYLSGMALLGATLLLAPAATLTSVPMQGGMVMPTFNYDTLKGALSVTLDPAIPQLIPLLVSHPGDGFDPADPWHDALDPSRQGLAFSKRYGFVMADGPNQLPAGTGIWIRKLAGSAELGFYRAHAMSLPHRWEPIFGTGGTSNDLAWNMFMFHPCATAPPGTNAYWATFEAFLVNTNTGVALPESTTGAFTLNWTCVPDGRPALTIAPHMVVDWPGTLGTNWVLEGTKDLSTFNWCLVTNAPVTVEGRPAVILETGETRKFFRMRYLP